MRKFTKRLLSLALAAGMLLTLMSGVAGASDSPMDVSQGLSVIDVDLKGSLVDFPTTLWTSNAYIGEAKNEDLSEYLAIKSGTDITVSNVGQTETSYLYLYLQEYHLTEGTTVLYLDEERWLSNVYYSSGQYYYLNDQPYQQPGQTPIDAGNGLSWNLTDDSPTNVPLMTSICKLVGAGESVTFHLPESDPGTLYRLYIAVYYPAYSDRYWRSWVELMEDDANAEKNVERAFSKHFVDVPSDSYYYEPIRWAYRKGITAGSSALEFSPEETCTQAQIITFLWRANGSPVVQGETPFSGVKPGDYYYNAVVWAYSKGIIDSTFSPNAACTRATAVTYLYHNAGDLGAAPSGRFTDVAGASYERAVEWALLNGVTSGTSDTTFSPNDTCTRGQIATFLYRAMNR